MFERYHRRLAAVTPVKCWCESNKYFCKIEISLDGEINKRSFSNHSPLDKDVAILGLSFRTTNR